MVPTRPRSRHTSTDGGDRDGRAMALAACLVAALSVTSASAQEGAAAPASLRIEAPRCAPGWYDAEAFARALSAELALDGVRVEPAGALALVVEASCAADADPTLALAIGVERRVVSLADVAPEVRMRALALGARDLVAEVRGRRALAPPIAPSRSEPTAAAEAAARLGPPEDPSAHGVGAPETSSPSLAVELDVRAAWLGLRVVAPSLAVEGQARLVGTPLVLWVALDGAYAVGGDALGEVRALAVGGRAGLRLVLDLAPVTLSLAAGAMAAYARAEGAPSGGDPRGAGATRGSVLEGPLAGIDVSVAGSVALSASLDLTLSVGALGYLLGLDARAEDRSVVSFRDVAPWAALGLRFALGTVATSTSR